MGQNEQRRLPILSHAHGEIEFCLASRVIKFLLLPTGGRYEREVHVLVGIGCVICSSLDCSRRIHGGGNQRNRGRPLQRGLNRGAGSGLKKAPAAALPWAQLGIDILAGLAPRALLHASHSAQVRQNSLCESRKALRACALYPRPEGPGFTERLITIKKIYKA